MSAEERDLYNKAGLPATPFAAVNGKFIFEEDDLDAGGPGALDDGCQHVSSLDQNLLLWTVVLVESRDQANLRRMKTTKPMRARASVKAIPRNMVVRTMPAASGWRAIASTDLPTR